MSIAKHSVILIQLPSEITPITEVDVLHRLSMEMANTSHARFVFDCCQLKDFGSNELDFLICCLEEVMKGDGDLRLIEMHPRVREQLTDLGVSALFEAYDFTPQVSSKVA